MQRTISSLKERIESTYAPGKVSNRSQKPSNNHERIYDQSEDQSENPISSDKHLEIPPQNAELDRDTEIDRYIKIVSWSDSDNCYIGLCPEVTSVECRGDNEKDVFESLCNIVDETVALHRLLGKNLPGSRQLIAGSVVHSHSNYFSTHQVRRQAVQHHDSVVSETTSSLPDAGTPYRFSSTLMSRQNRFLRHCSTRVRMS